MIWKPQKKTINLIKNNLDLKKSFKAFRSSSSAFVSNKKVRDFILNKFNNKCNNCGSKELLEIDHIKSVYNCFYSKDYFYCNSLENLQVLCKKCNTSKKP